MQRIQASQVTPGVLNSIAANFSIRDDATAELLPQSANWPTRLLPGHARASSGREVRSLAETVKRDSALVWDKPRFTEGTPVCAEFQGTDIRIRCLPMVAGRRLAYYGRYEKLPGETGQAGADLDLTVALKSVEAAFVRPDATTDEDWAVFAPILFALFAIARPRRFVNLGVNDGASLLTACRAAERFKIGTQCIAVDTWAHPGGGDDQSSQFEHFTRNLEEKYPRQHFIRAMFSEAVECFDDMSIDVLLIDAWADYDSAREQLELWLPKLSDVGIVLLRGTKAVREECGIWRLWTELKQKYPTVSFDHEDGLGVLYVGGSPSATAALMEMLGKDSQRTMLAQLFFERLGHLTARAARRPPEQHVGYREGDLLASTTVVKSMRRLLKLQLLRAKLIYLLMAPFARKQKHYAQKKQILRSGIRSLNSVLEDRAREHASRLRKPDPDAIHEKPPVGAYVAFNPEITPPGAPKGLHPKVRLIIPTRGCSKWLREFLKAYEDWGLKPTFAVDPGCEPKTLEILKATNTDMIFIDSTQIGNGEGIMPYLSKHVKEDYILRLDDDEFPTADFIAWVNSVPDSPYAFVTSWWIPRHEVALIDGEICSCHPKWLRVKVGNAVYENLHGGRFYRHRDVVYDQVGPHHGNFLSDYVSHCPPEARIVHLDYLVRTASERLAKLRVVEQRFPGNGWPFANHMIPEMAPRELLLPRKFHSPELDQLIAAILANIHEPSEEVVLKISEIAKIQQDRLTSDAIHFQY
ncbi:hypothetical protein GGD83_001846 [Rhodoblastus sphagnicola]|nr:class I SAM-dependent methyltransferase [Rhodoblastus sphagnicola]MBB4198053.1 hypothetical protein [Rhodoblastus sphagnicola]